MATGSRIKAKVVRFERKQMFVLADYTKLHYKESNLNNIDFAKKAAEDLKMEGLNRDHIRNLLIDLDIEPNHSRFVETEGGATAMARLATLEEHVSVLEKQLTALRKEVQNLHPFKTV